LRKLTAESRLDEAKVRIVTTAVGPENLLVPLGDDREASALALMDGALEVDDAPSVEHESAAGNAMAVDRDVGDCPQRAMVSEPERIHLSRARQHVTGFDLPRTAIRGYDIDAEISDSHVPLSGSRP
jgi:hypothetical protein